MPRNTSFHEYIVHDLLHDMSGVTSRQMFGGWGIYKNGVIFAIIIENELYTKVDEKNQPAFKNIGSSPFVYKRKDGKSATMSYWKIPEEIMEDREQFHELIQSSIEVSLRTKKKKS